MESCLFDPLKSFVKKSGQNESVQKEMELAHIECVNLEKLWQKYANQCNQTIQQNATLFQRLQSFQAQVQFHVCFIFVFFFLNKANNDIQ